MDLTHVHEKLGEARRSLDRMIEQERPLIHEPFTDHLTAFLAAGMSVRDRFRHINAWREKWEDNLAPYERRLLHVMREARNDEAHIARKSRTAKSRRRAKAGSPLCVGQEEIKVGVGSSYSDRSGRIEAYGSPAVLLALGTNATAVVYQPTYRFIIDGKKRKVTQVCSEYLALLQRMVADFEAANP